MRMRAVRLVAARVHRTLRRRVGVAWPAMLRCPLATSVSVEPMLVITAYSSLNPFPSPENVDVSVPRV